MLYVLFLHTQQWGRQKINMWLHDITYDFTVAVTSG